MDYRIERILEFIAKNLHKPLRLHELASSVNLSPWRVSHLFHSETGLSLREYVKRLRLEKTKESLETTFLRVKEIAALAGYGSAAQLIRDFRKAFGITPLEYRRRFLHRTARIRTRHSKKMK